MDGSFPSKAHLWPGPGGVALQEFFRSAAGVERPAELAGPHNPAEFARKLFSLEALHPISRNVREQGLAEPYSLQWFLNIEARRHSRHGKWIPKLLEFAKHSGDAVLGLGTGLGTDWAQYARHGASVLVCSRSQSQLGLIRRNFELRGLRGRFIHAYPACLPLDSASIDVVCISSLPDGVEQPEAQVNEVYRVLKPGGKVIAVTAARFDVDFWFHTVFFWYRLVAGRPAAPPIAFSGRSLRRLFGRFVEPKVYKRQLRRSEVPHIWRWLPLSFLARLMGRVLVLKAFKPLSAAIRLQQAAAA
jgi:ubiquinone/menaquinone biosynthesis C-methylase UbiE